MLANPATEALGSGRLHHLPLVTLYLTERCNSRCVTCDYWKHGQIDLSLRSVTRLLPGLRQLGTQVILFSGGEPLINPEWPAIARILQAEGYKLWLLTSGLSLAKHARRVAEVFEAVTVSLDGTNAATYAAIRGLDAFDTVCAGIRAASNLVPVSVRVTVQRANYQELPAFVELTRQLGARQVSFLAVDIANPHAFGRVEDFAPGLALQPEDVPKLEAILADLERTHAADFQSRFIAESPQKLRRIHQYFAAVCGLGEFPPVRCNAPELSAVIEAKGRVNPCFFIPGPPADPAGLERSVNSEPMRELRAVIRAGGRPECQRCVCSLWRDPGKRSASDFLLGGRTNG